jgi:hypothetical protein
MAMIQFFNAAVQLRVGLFGSAAAKKNANFHAICGRDDGCITGLIFGLG